ncbi:MAG: hypothetical protein GC165_01765 [Armatimonadetes bacterium]|nr:hypothetical protein [Armatimonadota bacterium]
MQPTSGPKTSQNNQTVPFQDRLYVAGNAGFLCLIVAVLWTALFIARLGFNESILIALAPPLIATGATVLIVGCSRNMVPKPILSSPVPITVPVIWCLICYLAVLLISTQETGATSVPDALLPAMEWSRMSNLLPVLAVQIVFLGLLALLIGRRQPV